jgi:hypothetical protein
MMTASADDPPLRLTATTDELGWVSFAVSGPGHGSVVVRERTGSRTWTVARLSLRDGEATRAHAVRWRCVRRTRRFTATLRGPGDRSERKQATVSTPSCAGRLRMIVLPARVRPGHDASVRVADTWRFGGIGATVCAREGERERCKDVQLPEGTRMRRARLRMRRAGRRTISLRSEFGQRLTARVQVRDDARLRMLVTGDSIIFGLFEALGRDFGDRVSVLGDPQPGRGITNPRGFLDWPAHARRTARADEPDVTVVFLGFADAGYPLIASTGEAVACCDPAWVAAYASRVSEMMGSYLRHGRGLVYWVLLPAPRSPAKAAVVRAENVAVRLAGRDYPDGVTVVDKVAAILSPRGEYQDAIRLDGREQVVRDADGLHLAAPGIRVAADIVGATVRGDGLLEPTPAARR